MTHFPDFDEPTQSRHSLFQETNPTVQILHAIDEEVSIVQMPQTNLSGLLVSALCEFILLGGVFNNTKLINE